MRRIGWFLLVLAAAAFLVVALPLARPTRAQDTPEVPEIPENLTATPRDGQVTLSWDPPADDGGAPILRYDYSYHKTRGGGVTEVTGDLSLTVTVTGPTNGTEHAFGVRAVSALERIRFSLNRILRFGCSSGTHPVGWCR